MVGNMEPYRYLEKVSAAFDTLNTREEINEVLDELEYLYELIDPEFQDLAGDLIAKLTDKLSKLD